MQNVLQVDRHVFPGNRQLKVWRPEHPQVDRRIRVVVEYLDANLCIRTSVAELARSVNMSRWRQSRRAHWFPATPGEEQLPGRHMSSVRTES